MEGVSLVSRVEEQLERTIALGLLPESGKFGSEGKLARSYAVSRSTVREALRRLAARGLVVQHPGRKTRAVALDEALTLENLGLALHDERSADNRRLLEGYFCLKRQVTVELLADCCTQASELELGLLGQACFALVEAARWESGERCAQLEFELLKVAARAAQRPGHLLLIQSLQRAFQGIAARVLPLRDCEALRQWAYCAMGALGERDAQALQRQLPPLLRACDEHLLGRLAPTPEGEAVREAYRPQEERLAVEPQGAAAVQPAALGLNPSPPGAESSGRPPPDAALTNPSTSRTGSCASLPQGGPQPEPPFAGSCGPTRVAVGEAGGPPHDTRGLPPPTAEPGGCAPRAPPQLASQDSPPRERIGPLASASRMTASAPSPEG